MKKIYKLSQEVNIGWDTYDSMVIIADSEKEAILLSYDIASTSSWAFEKDIKIECLGQANSNIAKSQVTCTSFNAG